MSLAGTWKKVKVDNGMAFGKAIGATDEQLAAQAQAVSTVTYEINGNTIKVTRVHKIGEKEIVSLIKFFWRVGKYPVSSCDFEISS